MSAIETTYKGHLFRSRLEARWAAMFDLLGWRWTYEPIDAAGYIPDFLLHGDDPVMVEVKPDSSFKGLKHHEAYVAAGLRSHWHHDFLILGSTPLPDGTTSCFDQSHHPSIGILGEHLGTDNSGNWHGWWAEAGLWNRCGLCGEPTFIHEESSYRSRLCGHGNGDHYLADWNHSGIDLEVLWGRAHEATRWSPR